MDIFIIIFLFIFIFTSQNRETARLNALHTKYRKMIEDANIEKVSTCWPFCSIDQPTFDISMRDFSNILQTLLEQQLAVEKGKLETEKIRLQALLEEKVHIWSARYCHLLYRNMADTWKYCENCFEPRCPLRCAALCCVVLRCVALCSVA